MRAIKCIVAGCLETKFLSILIDSIANPNRIILGDSSAALSLSNLKAHDGGLYKCVVSNEVGSDSKTFRLALQGPAEVVSINEEPNESFDNTLTVSCVVKGLPLPQVLWAQTRSTLSVKLDLARYFVKDSSSEILVDNRGNTLDQTGAERSNYYFRIAPSDPGAFKISIVFTDKRRMDVTELRCRAENVHKRDEKSFKIENYEKDFIEFVDEERDEDDVDVKLNEDFELLCNVIGAPKPYVQWTFVRTLKTVSVRVTKTCFSERQGSSQRPRHSTV